MCAMSRTSKILGVTAGVVATILLPQVQGVPSSPVFITGVASGQDGARWGLISGSCSWMEPVLGTDESTPDATDGIILANLALDPPESGWSVNPWPIRKAIIPDEADFSFPDLAGKDFFSFGVLLIGGTAPIRLSFGEEIRMSQSRASIIWEEADLAVENNALFDQRLTVEIGGFSVISFVPFPMPALTVDQHGTDWVLRIENGEPGTSWEIMKNSSLEGLWSSVDTVTLNGQGDVSAPISLLSTPPFFLKASLKASPEPL